jgi:hypothetical protein
MKSESETIVSNLLHEVACVRNLFHSSLIRTITCEQPYTLDDVISLLIAENIWTEYKRAGNGKWILKMEWNNE